eukprot:g8071.t1
MSIDRGTSSTDQNATRDSVESGNASFISNELSHVRRRIISRVLIRGASSRSIRSSIPRVIELSEDSPGPEWNQFRQDGDIRSLFTSTSEEDELGFSDRTIPSSASISSSELQQDAHPFLLNPPSSDSMFPCPETWNAGFNSTEANLRTRRTLMEFANSRSFELRQNRDECSSQNSRISSRRRLNPFTSVALSDRSELDYAIPPYCSLLQSGVQFSGLERCCRRDRTDPVVSSMEEWSVKICLKEYCPNRGYLSGTMTSFLKTGSSVVTFFEGEIIDNKNHTFKTSKWNVLAKTDIEYWTKFAEFRDLPLPVLAEKWQVPGLSDCPQIFMRWKECFFISKPEETTWTIQGFYYISICRLTGGIKGYYYDPINSPMQELELSPDRQTNRGFCFSHYEFK